jgi:cation:H+ antiporter
MKGDYDDAVANAVGSNIFDICVALGLPLTLYTGMELVNGGGNGAIDMTASSEGGVQELRIVLIILSAVIVGLFLSAPKVDEDGETMLEIRKSHGFAMLGVYALWTGYILMQILG